MQNGQMEVGMDEAETPTIAPDIDFVTGAVRPASAASARGTVTRNPRIVAISRISNILDGLDDESRGRAVRFIAEEYAEFLNG